MPLLPSLASSGHMPPGPTPRPRVRATGPTLTVVARREDRACNRLPLRDRATLLEWAATARAFGVCRVSLEHPDPQDEAHDVGDFVLIYDGVSEWARWAVAREAGRYLLWSPSTGRNLGGYATLAAALAAIRTPAC
jgi:hypothetical protein